MPTVGLWGAPPTPMTACPSSAVLPIIKLDFAQMHGHAIKMNTVYKSSCEFDIDGSYDPKLHLVADTIIHMPNLLS